MVSGARLACCHSALTRFHARCTCPFSLFIASLPAASPLLSEVCHRSDMTPVQKAVEKGQHKDAQHTHNAHFLSLSTSTHCALPVPPCVPPCRSPGWSDVLRALLAKDADFTAPCALYDGETALQLAKRFQFQEGIDILTHAQQVEKEFPSDS